MKDMNNPLAELSDRELTDSLKALVKTERGRCVDILKHLNEMDRRNLAVKKGFPSLFEYCVRELRYVNGTAARLIHAARAAKKYPILYRTLERGLLSVTTVSMLAPHLKWDNHRRLIRRATGKSAREVEVIVAALTPLPKAPADRVRFISVAAPAKAVDEGEFFRLNESGSPSTGPAESAPSSAAPAASAPENGAAAIDAAGPAAAGATGEPDALTSPAAASAAPDAPAPAAVERVFFSFTGDVALWRDFERAKELSRHRWPAGRPEEVFGGAIRALLERIDPERKIRRRDRARRLLAGTRSRHIPAAVKDEVWSRDGGRCAFSSAEGRVCGSRSALEFDHIRPWALGGTSDAANIRLLCRAHNRSEARRVFGEEATASALARRRDALRNGVKI